MPQPIMTRLNGEVNAALNHRETKEQFVAMGAEPTPSTPQQADAHIRAEVQRWLKVFKAAPR
jgi:tripartite-type tricarboxylate transporter receptor subunit TctC